MTKKKETGLSTLHSDGKLEDHKLPLEYKLPPASGEAEPGDDDDDEDDFEDDEDDAVPPAGKTEKPTDK